MFVKLISGQYVLNNSVASEILRKNRVKVGIQLTQWLQEKLNMLQVYYDELPKGEAILTSVVDEMTSIIDRAFSEQKVREKLFMSPIELTAKKDVQEAQQLIFGFCELSKQIFATRENATQPYQPPEGKKQLLITDFFKKLQRVPGSDSNLGHITQLKQ